MATTQIDELSPDYMGAERIALTLDPSQTRVAALESVLVQVDYAKTLPEGVVLPLELVVQGPSAGSYQRRAFTRVAPRTLVFTPREGGPHLVLLREVAHNRWVGKLRLDVEGETLERRRPL